MKKILLISDTHSCLDSIILKHVKQADEVWHAGDVGDYAVCEEIMKLKPLRAVFGNIDGKEIRSQFPENAVFYCEEVKVLMTHIGGNAVKYPSKTLELIKKEKPNIFICGHSHILKIIYDQTNTTLYMNPGAAGIHGFHQIRTALRFEIEGKEIKNLAVIEFGKRSSID